ncbi:hypothetical protein Hanom_Chr12g01167971 [Helianthus anomalus]
MSIKGETVWGFPSLCPNFKNFPEEVEVNAPGKNFPVLKWSRSTFETLLRDIQLPPEYGATYPQEGDTTGDAPAGYVTVFADFFGDYHLWLPLTVFVAEVLEYYKLHISQLSPLGVIQVRNFEYTFRALGIEPIVGYFRRFYQLSVSMGFFSFRQRDHTPKLMIPSKGMTKWKTKFFYVKAAAITTKLQFRNVTGTIITENISVPKADMVDWFPRLRIIGWLKFDNRQLWVLRMMLGRLSRNVRPVLWEKSGEEAPLWRMFWPNFKGEVEIVACVDGEEGFNRTIIGNFRMPDWAALNAVLPQGKGDLGALGDLAATGVPKQPVLKLSDKRQRKTKKPHEAVVVPPLVPDVAGIPHTCLRKYDDYVVVSDTLEGLGVLGGAAGGSTTGAEPVDVKKRKGDAPVASGKKAPKLKKARATVVPKPKPSITTKPREEPVFFSAAPPSPPKEVDVEVQKKAEDNPSIEVVSGGGTPPSVHAEDTLKKTAGETIVDTLDSSKNLFDPHEDDGNQGEKPKSLKKLLGPQLRVKWVRINLPLSLGRLNWSFTTPLMCRSGVLTTIIPLGMLCRGKMFRMIPLHARRFFFWGGGGWGTPFETARGRGLPLQNRINQLSSMLVGSSIIANAIMEDYNVLARREEETIRLRAEAEATVKAAREGAEQLEKDKAAFEKLKQTETWAANTGLK